MADAPIPFMRGVEVLRGRAALELIMVRQEALRRTSLGQFADGARRQDEDGGFLTPEQFADELDEPAELDFDDDV